MGHEKRKLQHNKKLDLSIIRRKLIYRQIVSTLREWNQTQSWDACNEILEIDNISPFQNPQDISPKSSVQSEMCDPGPLMKGYQEVWWGPIVVQWVKD